MSGPRRKARIIAFQALFEADCSGKFNDKHLRATLDRFIKESRVLDEAGAYAQRMGAERLAHELERELTQIGEAEPFARELVAGVLKYKQKIDRTLGRHAPAWPVEEIAPTDRNILRIALFEILFHNKTPAKAAIDEAVELAKLYGSESSSKFVNGVLGSVMRLKQPDSLVSTS